MSAPAKCPFWGRRGAVAMSSAIKALNSIWLRRSPAHSFGNFQKFLVGLCRLLYLLSCNLQFSPCRRGNGKSREGNRWELGHYQNCGVGSWVWWVVGFESWQISGAFPMTLKAAQLRNAWLPPMIMDAAFGPAIWQATAVNLIFPLGINKQAHGCGGVYSRSQSEIACGKIEWPKLMLHNAADCRQAGYYIGLGYILLSLCN